MSTRGDFADDYEEARRQLKERWRDSTGEVKCPQCRQEALGWDAHEGKVNSLSINCELCNMGDWMYFEEDPPWSGRD